MKHSIRRKSRRPPPQGKFRKKLPIQKHARKPQHESYGKHSSRKSCAGKNPAQEKPSVKPVQKQDSAAEKFNTYRGNRDMSTTNAERLRVYKAKMKMAGFKRLSVYVHPDLVAFLNREREPCECGGRALERLLLGEAKKRPPHR